MALITLVRDLHRRKARERRGLALAEGTRLVEEMLGAGVRCKGALVAPALDTTARGRDLRAALEAARIPLEELTDAELASEAATDHPQGVVAVYQPRTWELVALRPAARRAVIVLDGVQDPGNVGTIARSALAFDAAGLVALPGTADLTSPKTVRSAMGALFRLPHCHAGVDAFAGWLGTTGAQAWLGDAGGSALRDLPRDIPLALVIGNEGAGASDAVRTVVSRVVTITTAHVESLNAAIAASILLHHAAGLDA